MERTLKEYALEVANLFAAGKYEEVQDFYPLPYEFRAAIMLSATLLFINDRKDITFKGNFEVNEEIPL